MLAAMVSLSAMDSEDDARLDAWRNGFVTAYKAMKVDTKIQGIENREIKTEKYIIYFDANSDDIATWDKLMVQMFGYSSSIHKPIRTTNNWIIFDSYEDKATAKQELELLNNRIFKNSKKYKLSLFENKENKKFFNDKALLTSDLNDLKNLLKIIEKSKLEKIKNELEENQKVALVYVDNKTGEIISDIKKFRKNKRSKPKVKKPTEKVAQAKKVDLRKVTEAKQSFKKSLGYVKLKPRKEVIVFSKPSFDLKSKVRNSKKHEIFDDDLQALVTEVSQETGGEAYKLVSVKVCAETGEVPNATVALRVNGEEKVAQSSGGGSVDATFKAIEAIANSETELQLYSVNSITSGTDAQGEVTVRLERGGRIVNGQGADVDIVIASAKAYINALNKISQPEDKPHPQLGDL